MGRMSLETRAKVIAMRSRNYNLKKIREHLEEEVSLSKLAIYMLIKKYDEIQTIEDIKRKPRPQLLQEEHCRFVDNLMVENNVLKTATLRRGI